MKLFGGILASLHFIFIATDASAQSSYPDKPVRILVGFTPGVAPDITARLLADKLTESWGKAVVVDYST